MRRQQVVDLVLEGLRRETGYGIQEETRFELDLGLNQNQKELLYFPLRRWLGQFGLDMATVSPDEFGRVHTVEDVINLVMHLAGDPTTSSGEPGDDD